MSRIVLSTSSSGIEHLNISHNIQFIRLHVEVNNVEFIDGKNLTAERLSQIMLTTPSTRSKTSPATEVEVREQLNKLYEQGYRDVFIVCISSVFSDSYLIISQVAKEFADRMNIYVYDTKMANLGEGALAYEADVMLLEGKSFDEIVRRLDVIRHGSTIQFAVNDLSHLIKNQKLSMAAGFFANLLDIKPILEINQAGEVTVVEKIRRIENSLDYIGINVKKMMQRANFTYLISCGDDLLDQYFIDLLDTKYNIRDLPITYSSTISLANHGVHTVGIGTFVNEIPKIAQFIW